jgi:hypothetical protein
MTGGPDAHTSPTPPRRNGDLLVEPLRSTFPLPHAGMTLRRTLPAVAACAALFGVSFAAGNAFLDDEDSPRARPTPHSPPVESAPPAVRPRLARALGRAAGLPGLRTPPRPAKRASTQPRLPAPPPAADSPVDTAPAEPSPVAETQPVVVQAPPQQASPPAPPAPTRSSPPSSSPPGPDAAPSAPSPAPDPAPSGGAEYEPDGE